MLKRIMVLAISAMLVIGCSSTAWMGNLAPKPPITDVAVLQALKKESDASPRDLEKKSRYYRERENLANARLLEADAALQASNLDFAESAYQSVFEFDPQNPRARNGLKEVLLARAHAELLTDAEALIAAEKLDEAELKLREVLTESPRDRLALKLVKQAADKRKKALKNQLEITDDPLRKALKRPITLEFRDAPLKAVFEMLAKSAGINFVLDKDVKADQKITLFVKNNNVEDVVDVMLVSNQLSKKVLNANTFLIYPNNVQKNKDYQELTVRTFYLANADAKQVSQMLKTLLKAKDVYIDEKLNMLAIRDTPDAVRIAEKLVLAQDIAEPEVVLEVEVLELSRTLTQDLGVRFPTSLSVLPLTGTGNLKVGDLRNLDNRTRLDSVSLDITSLKLMLQKSNGTVNTLANPRIRVKNREKARVQIGDKVPVITSTSTLGSTVPTTSDSVSYIDTGIKLEVEPTVYLDEEVTIKLNLEVSNIVKEVRSTTTGTLTYQIGNRTANTVLRLKDGDTQILAGLIKDDDRRSDANVPGLSSLPIIGRLFSERADTREKTEIVLLITPHIVRNIPPQDINDANVLSGTETGVGKSALSIRPNAQMRSSSSTNTGAGRNSPTQEQNPADMPTQDVIQPESDVPPEQPAESTSILEAAPQTFEAQPLRQEQVSPQPVVPNN